MSVQTSNLGAARTSAEWHPTVRDARILDRRRDGDRILEIVLEARIERVPPGVLESLAEYDCGISDVTPQGEHLVVEVR